LTTFKPESTVKPLIQVEVYPYLPLFTLSMFRTRAGMAFLSTSEWVKIRNLDNRMILYRQIQASPSINYIFMYNQQLGPCTRGTGSATASQQR
jgi:hypothetical protein